MPFTIGWKRSKRVLNFLFLSPPDGQFYVLMTSWGNSSKAADLRMRRDRLFQVGEAWRVTGEGIQSIFQRSPGSPCHIPGCRVVSAYLVSKSDPGVGYNYKYSVQVTGCNLHRSL